MTDKLSAAAMSDEPKLGAAAREIARAICRVQLNGGDPDQPAMRWNGTEPEPQESPAWHDYRDEAAAVLPLITAALADLDAAKAEAAHWKQQYAVVVRKLHEASDCLDTKDDEVERLREALENCHDLFWDNHCRAGVDIVHKALAAPQDGGNDER